MATSCNVSGPRQTFVPVRLGLSLFDKCRAAFVERRERQRIRAMLLDLSDRELNDVGISRGEIEYLALNRDIDSSHPVRRTNV